mmetsp:Transcript_22959/g.60442  ORF Transcript_22959/g.60442 Transcript_22959/m.60442 type:complete len:119 (-) Transcript_22959:1103-1459(-)
MHIIDAHPRSPLKTQMTRYETTNEHQCAPGQNLRYQASNCSPLGELTFSVGLQQRRTGDQKRGNGIRTNTQLMKVQRPSRFGDPGHPLRAKMGSDDCNNNWTHPLMTLMMPVNRPKFR